MFLNCGGSVPGLVKELPVGVLAEEDDSQLGYHLVADQVESALQCVLDQEFIALRQHLDTARSETQM